MERIFLRVVNYSFAAGWLVAAVLILRPLLHRAGAPKRFNCVLWGLVALRLVVPFSIESPLSLVPSAKPLPDDFVYSAHPYIESGITYVDRTVGAAVSSALETGDTMNSVNRSQVLSFVLSRVWIVGVAGMMVYLIVSTVVLRRRLATATLLKKGVKQSEMVRSPFVMGIFKPVIYMPYKLAGVDFDYVLAHEQAHIDRRDCLRKLLGFLLLGVYWFNPLMWAAYIFLCRDIESACDERVIGGMEKESRRAYSIALLNCSAVKRRMGVCPLSFGENGTKTRIRDVMNYRKPTFWAVIAAAAACVIVAVCFLTNPVTGKDKSGTMQAVRWFDCLDTDEYPSDDVREKILDEYPDMTLCAYSDRLDAVYADRVDTLFNGMPVWNVYFADVTGDGRPDVCATISVGSGIIDERVMICDLAEGKLYELSARGKYDYTLYLEGDLLYIMKRDNASGDVVERGPVSFYENSFKAVY